MAPRPVIDATGEKEQLTDEGLELIFLGAGDMGIGIPGVLGGLESNMWDSFLLAKFVDIF